MARKRKQKNSSPSLLLVFFLALIVLGAWLYQQSLRHKESSPAPAPAPQTTSTEGVPSTIRIATWNLRHFGGQTTTDYRVVSKIITDNHFDVVAIQEVQKDGRGVDTLLNTLGFPWRSTSLSPESRSGERLAFIYRGDHLQEVGKPEVLPNASPGNFERVPYCATFKAGNFDFQLITVHLTWGDVAQRQQEAAELAKLLPRMAGAGVGVGAGGQVERDLIILGDFNEQRTRPNLHYFADANWETLVTDYTNLSSKETYDHILINATYTKEYDGSTGVYHFDEDLFKNQDKEAVKTVSDHRPAWADFKTTLPDDD